ncbi:phosphopantetheine-binding protein [Cerasicoccus fimbriatus]|uniref:phosphopantetheine-binding protein n=1 Tax=Cerasicoccus fimbriatus TaxID=3014554 RepID=UPI0022B2E4F8|nr:phosphopantetheine-binding protein [Cerasicoccus sp. TK19100]
MSDLTDRLKTLIVDALQLDDVEPQELDNDEPLMDNGLGLDSIDALELVVRVEKEFGIKIKNSEEAREALASINSLAAFIQSRQS